MTKEERKKKTPPPIPFSQLVKKELCWRHPALHFNAIITPIVISIQLLQSIWSFPNQRPWPRHVAHSDHGASHAINFTFTANDHHYPPIYPRLGNHTDHQHFQSENPGVHAGQSNPSPRPMSCAPFLPAAAAAAAAAQHKWHSPLQESIGFQSRQFRRDEHRPINADLYSRLRSVWRYQGDNLSFSSSSSSSSSSFWNLYWWLLVDFRRLQSNGARLGK